MNRGGPDQWADLTVRQQWVDARLVDPNVGNTGMRRPLSSSEDWAAYQARVAGDQEIRLVPVSEDLGPIWADGVRVDPDGVVAVAAKFVENPGGRSMYEGGRPDFLLDDFADELEGYAAVIVDQGNPVARLNIITSPQTAKDFLTTWAAAKMAPHLGELDVSDVLTVTLVP